MKIKIKIKKLQICATKSSDQKISLLEYVGHTIKTKFPELCDFYEDLEYVETASQGKP